MWSWLKTSFQDHPELAAFLAVGLGAILAKIPLGRVARLGLVPGTLLAGVVIGATAHVKVPTELSSMFFVLFLFAIGYKVGPQFFKGLRGTGLQQAGVSLTIFAAGLGVVYVVAKVASLDPGAAGGLFAGGLTQSSAVATATDTIARLDVSSAARTSSANLVAVGYAVTYLFGSAGAAWWTSTVLPRIFRFDLRHEARQHEQRAGMRTGDGLATAYTTVVQRTYRITSPELDGRTVAELEAASASRGHRVFAIRLRRADELLECDPELVLAMGDVVAVVARREAIVAEHLETYGVEVDDRALLDFEMETVDAVVTHKGMAGRSVADLRSTAFDRGVYVGSLTRAGFPIELRDETVVQGGDELQLTGPRSAVEVSAKQVGFLQRLTPESDILLVSMGIVLGGLVGLPAITAANTTLRLTTSVGALVAGLFFGWLRGRRPTFGRVPPAAQWIFETFALALAIAVIGINAGPNFVDGIRHSGVTLLLGGVVVTLVPLTVGMVVAYKVFRMPAVIALGACAGGQTSTPTLAAVNDASASTSATLGYTVPYAIGSVLLTLGGSIIIHLLT